MCPFLIGYNGRFIITCDKWTYITWPLHLVIEMCRPTNGCSRHPIPPVITMQLGRLGVYLEHVACFLMSIICFIMRIWWQFIGACATTVMMTIHMPTKGLRFVKRLITKSATELSLFSCSYFFFRLCEQQTQTTKMLLVDACSWTLAANERNN